MARSKSVIRYNQEQLQKEVIQDERHIEKIKRLVQQDNSNNLKNPVPIFDQILDLTSPPA